MAALGRGQLPDLSEDEINQLKYLVEDIEFGLSRLMRTKPPFSLKELHNKSLLVHKIIGAQ